MFSASKFKLVEAGTPLAPNTRLNDDTASKKFQTLHGVLWSSMGSRALQPLPSLTLSIRRRAGMLNSASGYTDQVPGETAWTHLHSVFFQLFLPVWASQPFRSPTVRSPAAN